MPRETGLGGSPHLEGGTFGAAAVTVAVSSSYSRNNYGKGGPLTLSHYKSAHFNRWNAIPLWFLGAFLTATGGKSTSLCERWEKRSRSQMSMFFAFQSERRTGSTWASFLAILAKSFDTTYAWVPGPKPPAHPRRSACGCCFVNLKAPSCQIPTWPTRRWGQYLAKSAEKL